MAKGKKDTQEKEQKSPEVQQVGDDILTKGSNSGDMKGIGAFGKIVGLLVLVWLASVSYYAVAFFILGMLPSIVAMFIDRGSGHFASKTILACNFVGVLPYLFEIGITFERSVAAKELMSSMETWFIVYGFSVVGWMMIWVLPQVTLVIFTVRADVKVRNLTKIQEKLVEEWGDEVITWKKKKKN